MLTAPAGVAAWLGCACVIFAFRLACMQANSAAHTQLCRDVRGAVDLCHRDGSIKREVAANPEK